MVTENLDTRLSEALAISSVESNRLWVTNYNREALTFRLENPQVRVLNRQSVFTVDVLLGIRGTIVFDDRVNLANPVLATRLTDGSISHNPYLALQKTLLDVALITTEKFTRPRLERILGNDFRGDTLAVRSTTADGKVESDGTISWSTARQGNSLSATTAINPDTVEASDIGPGTEYQIRQFFLDFDTSSLGSGATLSNGVFTLYGTGTAETNTNSYDMEIRPKDWGGTLTTADYVATAPTSGWTNLTLMSHFAVASWNQTNNTANNFTVDSYVDISKTAVTYVVMGLSGIGSTTAPTGVNLVTFYTADNTGTSSDPLLTVTYTPGGKGPVKLRPRTLRSQHRR